MKATTGRIVHFVMDGGDHRPAIIVQPWGDGECANLQVFVDGSNDRRNNISEGAAAAGIMWRTSVLHSEEQQPGTWHWPEIEE